MKEKIDERLEKVKHKISEGSPQESTPTTSKPVSDNGSDVCSICGGSGYLRQELPIDHPDFGKLQACSCRAAELNKIARDKLFEISQLDELSDLTFENFYPKGKTNYAPEFIKSIGDAYDAARDYSQTKKGWLLIKGGFGCGKTHLAAAIANFAIDLGISTMFITAPDLLDLLRFTYNDPETTFEQRFEEIRQAELLVLDDFGTENATKWAQEKLFQIINFRYINKLPLVITTNIALDEIEPRIRSRLQDENFVNYVDIAAPDYRLSKSDTSNPSLSTLHVHSRKTFFHFVDRDGEKGSQTKIKSKIEVTGKDGIIKREERTTVTIISDDDLETLKRAHYTAVNYAENPTGWLILMGVSGSGKTHLAAGIGNYRRLLGAAVVFVDCVNILDYLRATFSSDLVSYQQRLHEIQSTPLLILDGFGDHRASSWGKEKLNQILNHRFYRELPTVVTTSFSLEDMEDEYESLLNKFLDSRVCEIRAIGMPAYRGQKKSPKKKRR